MVEMSNKMSRHIRTSGYLHKGYVESESWKCPKSPTSAHWWVETIRGSEVFKCKFCQDKRKFNNTQPSKYGRNKPADVLGA